ncbi:MAG TPA: hypothetical protein VF363_02330 [Candidatus Eisenbacteria bacterium]
MEGAGARLRLELIATKHVAPIFLLLPWGESPPRATLFLTWHSEALSVAPAAVEGAERLALAATLGAVEALAASGLLGSPGSPEVAVTVAPGATQGSMVLDGALREHRPRLQSPVAFWIRVAAAAPKRRRVFLGARGRVVIGIWDEGPNPYEIRDQVVAELSEEAYGPRPLDFELLRKLAGSAEAVAFLAETSFDPGLAVGVGEGRFRHALFEPRGEVLRPSVRHPGRPQSWLAFETAEAAEPADVLRRVQAKAAGARVEMVEAYHWDRLNIHHPIFQALIGMAKSRSEGPEIWPMAPWVTPSGLFTRALGVGLGEWGIALPDGAMMRFPKPEALEAISREAAELILLGLEKAAPNPRPEA